jgi:hypothetical protein
MHALARTILTVGMSFAMKGGLVIGVLVLVRGASLLTAVHTRLQRTGRGMRMRPLGHRHSWTGWPQCGGSEVHITIAASGCSAMNDANFGIGTPAGRRIFPAAIGTRHG